MIARLSEYLTGWKSYFFLGGSHHDRREIDKWIRHRLRTIQLKQWKRGTTVFRELRSRGASEDVAARVAANARRWWKNASMAIHIALPTRELDALGVPRLAG